MSYIRLDRKMLSWGWKDDPKMVALWVHILLEANWKQSEWHGITYEEGTFPTSVEKLSVATGLSTKSVRTCLEKLKKSGEILVQTANKGTKISVIKWAEYQCSDDDEGKPIGKQKANEGQTRGKHRATLKEIEEVEEVEEYKKSSKHPTIDDVRSYCLERHNNVDAERFWNYYESNGWKVGRNPMKDWKACVRTWERKNVNTNVRTDDTVPIYSTANNSVMSKNEEKELLALMGKA